MTALLVLLGLLAALFTAVVILFTAGIVPAGVVLVIILVVMVAGIMLAGTVKKLIVFGFLILVIATLGFGGYSGYQLYSALTDTSGPADPADPVALASIEAKLDAIELEAGFRIELTE